MTTVSCASGLHALPQEEGWSELHEIRFLEGLGHHRDHVRNIHEQYPGDYEPRLSRLQLLQNYRASIRHRERWENICAETVRDAVERMIWNETKRP